MGLLDKFRRTKRVKHPGTMFRGSFYAKSIDS